jgi:hypothetical protein
MLAGLGATMAQGFAFGAGSAVAKVAVNSAMDMFSGGGSKEAAAPVNPPVVGPSVTAACEVDYKAFQQCMTDNNGSASSCDYYNTALQACQQRQ